jgi:hypothetical protein
VAAVAEPVKLTWWQRLIAWFKRLFSRKPKPAPAAQAQTQAAPAAPAAPAAGAVAAAAVADSTLTTPAPAAGPAATAPPAAKQPGAQAPTAEKTPTARPPGRERQVGPKVPSALKPTKEFERKAPKEVKEAPPQYEPGDLICTQCGTGNKPTNKFCKRCGSSLAEAPTAQKPSWWKRLLTALHLRRRKQFEAGYRKKQKGGRRGVFWRLQGLSFRAVGLVSLAIIGIGLYGAWGSTLKDRAQSYYDYFHDLVLPSYSVVHPLGATASSHLNQKHSAGKAIDNIDNDSWISKPSKKSGVGQTLTITFSQPIRLGKIGFRNGDQTGDKTYLKQARFHKTRVFLFNKKNKLFKGKSKVITLQDTDSFQSFGFDVKGVKKIKLRAVTVYPSEKGKSVAMSEVEIRAKK